MYETFDLKLARGAVMKMRFYVFMEHRTFNLQDFEMFMKLISAH